MFDIVENSISLLIEVLVFAIFVQVLMSWFIPRGGAGKLSILLAEITDPILMPLRRLIPPFGGLDLSPLIAILVLELFLRPILQTFVAHLAGA